MIPLIRNIFHALLWDPMAVRRWLRGMAVSFAVGGVAFADQIAAVLGSPGAAKTVKIVALALAFIGGAISVGQQNPKDGLVPMEPPKGFAQLEILIALVLLLVAAAVIPLIARGAVPCPNPARSQAQVELFKAQWSAAHAGRPCPQGPAVDDDLDCRLYHRVGRAFILYEACGACEVDHRCPLACCGADTPANMHWMDKHANRAKGADCTACLLEPPK